VANEIKKTDKKRLPWSEKERKFVLPKYTHWDTKFLPVIQNLVSVGMTEADIGAMVGFQGVHAEDWLNELKRHHPEVKEAAAIGKQIADSVLVAQMYRSAVGYDYEEVEYRRDKETGEMVESKRVLKHQPGNAQLAIFMATNHMPDQYKNRVEQTKRSFIINASGEMSEDQISKLAGRLLEESNVREIIDAKVVEIDDESEGL
jgi:hypothetical protein